MTPPPSKPEADRPTDFARIIIASDGAQVLFYKREGDDGPGLMQATCMDGVTLEADLSFDKSTLARDEAFEAADIRAADRMRALVATALGKQP